MIAELENMSGGLVEMTLGDRVKRLREARGWSQLRLSEATGINNSVISRIESNDKKTFDDNIITKLADVFEVSTDYLFGKTTNPNPVDAGSELASRLRLDISASDLLEKFQLEMDGKIISKEKAEAAIAVLRSLLDK
jgi:transcriptional regulator with XRE-family HTH domain